MHRYKRRFFYSPIISCILLFCIGVTSILAAPTDPFNGDNPTSTDQPGEAELYNAGDSGVSEQRGAATYTYPITLPPSRNNMAPNLALRYSSQAAVRGGLAVGWSLDLPSIRIDRALGYSDETVFSASLSSTSGRLVAVADTVPSGYTQAYRVNFDSGYTRFFRKGNEAENYSWMALTQDGRRHYFEHELSAAEGLPWVITREEDPFGNTVHYQWSAVTTPLNIDEPVELRLDAIEYAENPNASLAAHARVEFDYAPLDICPDSNVPIGAASYVDGKLDGASRLNEIEIMVRDLPQSDWRLSRRIDLGYETDSNGFIPCEQGEAPLRYLTRIMERAWDANGDESVLPPATFTYNRQVEDPSSMPMNTVNVISYPSYGHYRGAIGGMLDLDSDGVQDQVRVATENNVCTMIWHKGLLGGGYEATERRISLPTASWIYGAVPQAGELCTFSGQKTMRARLGNLPNNDDCELPPSQATLSYHFMDINSDGRVDLLTNVWAAENEWGSMRPPFLPEPPQCVPSNGKVGAASIAADDPTPEIPIFSAPHMEPERTGNETSGRFVWRVYMNTGGSNLFETFPSLTMNSPAINLSHPNPTVPGQPRINPPSLSPSAGENGVMEGWRSSMPSLLDLDGDGYLDFIDVGQDQAGLGSTDGKWEVYFGQGDGTFSESAHHWQILPVTVQGSNEPTTTVADGWVHTRHETVAAVRDLSGDGLPDLVVLHGGSQLKMYRNTGDGFSRDAVNFDIDQPLEIMLTDYEGTLSQTTINNGQREFIRRLLDVDGDGLADLIDFPTGDGQLPQVRYNLGDRFLNPQPLPINWRAARHYLTVVDGQWQQNTDLADDGDGIADLVHWHTNGQQRTLQNIGYTTAPRTLQQVDNGRGMLVTYTYRPTTDPAVVTWNTAEETYLSAPKWVVSKLEVDGGFGTPAMVKEYTYGDPAFQSDAAYTNIPEQSAFRGFRTTTMTTVPQVNGTQYDVPPKRVTSRYAYDEAGSPSGSLVEEWTYAGSAEVASPSFTLYQYRERTWQRHQLFNQALYVTVPKRHVTRICQPGSSTADCMEQTVNLHRVDELWEAHPSKTNPQLYKRTSTEEGSSMQPSLGDRRTEYGYEIRYGQSPYAAMDYRMLPTLTRYQRSRLGREGLIFADSGRKEIIYAQATGLPETTKQWLDAGTIATVARTFDPLTGNLITKTKPEQVASSGQGSGIVYDGHRVTVAMVSNELDQKVYTTHDIATGVLVERRGPNSIQQGSDLRWEREQFTIDGFGRIVEHAVAVDDPASGQPYTLQTVAKTTYFDEVLPNRVRTEQLIDFGGTVWTRTDVANDGMGRRLSETTDLDGGLQTVTSHGYDSAGNRNYLEVPDPRTDDTSTVIYRYQYDGLERMVEEFRPDNSGTRITYIGLEQTTEEVTADGSGATIKEIFDVYGRLLQVEETNPEIGKAVTEYRYDINDNIAQILDADGNVTTMTHNWASHRTLVRRGSRQWSYRYDHNGNMLEEVAPMEAGADATLHTVTRSYDALDRLLSVTYADPLITEFPEDPVGLTLNPGETTHTIYLPLVAQGGENIAAQSSASDTANNLATAQTTAGVIDYELTTVNYTYDQGNNGVGYLSQVAQQNSTVEYLIDYVYDPRGLVVQETREVQLPGVLANLTAMQMVERSYNALGAITESNWDDGRTWRAGYDRRGLLDTVEWYDPNRADWQQVVDYYRSPGGLIRERLSSYGQQRSITYDLLGRPATDQVVANGTTVAQRSYMYDDAGNLKTMTGQTSGVVAKANYTYDAQHRLRTASGPNGYQGTFTYSKAGNLVSAAVNWNGSQAARNVRYEYGAVDPHAVDTLVHKITGKEYATFDYDLAGNMTSRHSPGGVTVMTWDGLDRLRMAETPNGPEVYYYDHEGNRLLAINPQQSRFWFAERETHYDMGGSELERYLHLMDNGGTVARVDVNDQLELQYADALQNLMVAIDAQANVVANFFYGPFGEIVQSTGAQDHRRQFNGKENDQMTGLRYYGFRYYDPLVLRWNSADPLYRFAPDLGMGEPQRMNLYSFSLNNPVRYYDPDGRDAKEGEKNPDQACDKPKSQECIQAGKPPKELSPEQIKKEVEAAIANCESDACVAQYLLTISKACEGSNICVKQEMKDGSIELTKRGKQILSAMVQVEFIGKAVNRYQQTRIMERTNQALKARNELVVGEINGRPYSGTRENFQREQRRQALEGGRIFNGSLGGITAGAGFGVGIAQGRSHEDAMNVARVWSTIGTVASALSPRGKGSGHNLVQRGFELGR